MQVSSCHINRLLKEMGLSTRPKDNTTEKQTSSQQNSSIRIQDLPPVIATAKKTLVTDCRHLLHRLMFLAIQFEKDQ
jgi:hypothetical protein